MYTCSTYSPIHVYVHIYTHGQQTCTTYTCTCTYIVCTCNICHLYKLLHSVIATPGRFLHILIEMDLKLSSVEYVVFDEADRLFEMGFSEQLKEIIRRMPEMRYMYMYTYMYVLHVHLHVL